MIFLERRKICKIKNHSIWTCICGKIKEQKEGHKKIMMREKFIKLHQIKLIDELKLNSNDRGQRIKGRTCNVTQKVAQNDPINFLIKAFHSMFRKTESWSSSGELLLLL